jgi:hypothetical protein
MPPFYDFTSACDRRVFALNVLRHWERDDEQTVAEVAEALCTTSDWLREFFYFIEDLSCETLREHLCARDCRHLLHLM